MKHAKHLLSALMFLTVTSAGVFGTTYTTRAFQCTCSFASGDKGVLMPSGFFAKCYEIDCWYPLY